MARPSQASFGLGGGVNASKLRRPVPRLSLRAEEAAESLGVSVDHFQRHVQDDLRCVYSGRVRLYPITELERWLERQAARSIRRVS